MRLSDEIRLPADVCAANSAANSPASSTSGDLFLTGGTGYLGAHLLGELLARRDATIHCLVRAGSPEQARQRLFDNLSLYDVPVSEHVDRLVPVLGDISQPRLGIEPAEYARLTRSVSEVFHAGASVSFGATYERIKPANVDGVRHILQFAAAERSKFVHYVSTYAVFNASHYRGPSTIPEHDLADDGSGLLRGYGQSKWVAEGLCRLARERGLSVNVFRAGIISGHSRTGRCNTADTMALTMLAVLGLSAAMNTDFLLHLTPVDYCSAAIAALSADAVGPGRSFHLINPQPIRWQAWLDWVARAGHAVERLPPVAWYDRLKAAAAKRPALLPLVMLLQHDANRDFWNASNIFHSQFATADTEAALARHGLHCPPVDGDLLTTYLDFLVRAGDDHFVPRKASPLARPAGADTARDGREFPTYERGSQHVSRPCADL